jgi:DNA-binding MarR family transcriptional regulator
MDDSQAQLNKERDLLGKAKVLVRDADPQIRESAIGILRRLGDGAFAKEAGELIRQYDAEPLVHRDKEVAEFREYLAPVDSLTHTKLLPLIKQAKNNSMLATQVRHEFISKLKNLIERMSRRAVDSYDENDISHFRRVMDALGEIDIYEAELHSSLNRLRAVELKFRLHHDRPHIDRAMRETGDVSRAWEIIDLVGANGNLEQAGDEGPGSMSEVREWVEQLKGEVSQVQCAVRDAESLTKRGQLLPPKVGSWAQAKETLRFYEEAKRFLKERMPPQKHRHALSLALEQTRSAVQVFLKEQGTSVADFKNLRFYWEEYRSLPRQVAEFAVSPDWFETYGQNLRRQAEEQLGRAVSPTDLSRYLDELKRESFGLPPDISFVNVLINELEQVVAAWETMRAGEAFTLPAGLRLPGQFIAESEAFGEKLERIERAFERLGDPGVAENEAALEEIAGEATSILSEVPGHALARRLKRAVQLKVVNSHVERAVRQWDIEELSRLVDAAEDFKDSHFYKRNLQTLLALKQLTRRPAFANWEKSAGWWGEWLREKKALLMETPAVLNEAFRKVEAARQAEWLALLDGLKNVELDAAVCDKIADSLQIATEGLDLIAYQELFRRKGALARVQREIAAGNWDGARSLLVLLGTNSEADRLHTILKVEEAKAGGVLNWAVALSQLWGNIQRYLDSPENLLLDAVETAWSQEQNTALWEYLLPVIDRVAGNNVESDTDSAAVRSLRRWREWLQLEQELFQPGAEHSLKSLYRYSRDNSRSDPLFPQRQARLVAHWRREQNLVPLIWARVVWGKTVVADKPLDELIYVAAETAKQTMQQLRERTDLTTSIVAELLDKLVQMETLFRRIRDVLELSGNRENKVQPTEEFVRVLEQVKMLLEAMQTLDDSTKIDLRGEKAAQDFRIASFNLQKNLRDMPPVRKSLLALADRLEPLTNLRVIEDHIHEAAAACGDDESWFKENLFHNLKLNLAALCERFEKADLVDGPMWREVSAEYCRVVFDKACVLSHGSPPPGLLSLLEEVENLHRDELIFREQINALWKQRPSIGAGEGSGGAQHQEYFARFPAEPPRSRRDYLYFEHVFAGPDDGKVILRAGQRQLPGWIKAYLKKGSPSCGDR